MRHFFLYQLIIWSETMDFFGIQLFLSLPFLVTTPPPSPTPFSPPSSSHTILTRPHRFFCSHCVSQQLFIDAVKLLLWYNKKKVEEQKNETCKEVSTFDEKIESKLRMFSFTLCRWKKQVLLTLTLWKTIATESLPDQFSQNVLWVSFQKLRVRFLPIF